MTHDDRELWRTGDLACVMISCCAGAELQLRRGDEILLRELYPMKTDLYERARDLRAQHASAQQADARTRDHSKDPGPGTDEEPLAENGPTTKH